MQEKVKRICERCKKEFEVLKKNAQWGRGIYCSKKCATMVWKTTLR